MAITNANSSDDQQTYEYDLRVTDGKTYTKSGAALHLTNEVTENSGSVTDTSNALKITNSHTQSTGAALNIINTANAPSIFLETDKPTSTVVGLIQLKFDDGDVKNKAKAVIAYVDDNDNEVIWLQAHDWLDDTTQHKHFSIEASDEAGLKQTRLGVGYGADIVDVTVNQANLVINRNTGETNGNIEMSGGGGGGNIQHLGDLDIYPDSATNGSVAFSIQLDGSSNLRLAVKGANDLYIDENLTINRGSGNCTLRLQAPDQSDQIIEFYNGTTVVGDITYDESAVDLYMKNNVTGSNSDIIFTTGTQGETMRLKGTGQIIMAGLPTADPSVAGSLWNNSGVINISSG